MNGVTQRQRQHHNYHSLAAPATATTIHHAHHQYHSQRASFLDHIIGDTQKRQRHEAHSVAAPTTLTAAGAVAAAGTAAAAAAAARMHAPVTVIESTQNPPPHHPSPPPPREPAPVLAPPTPQMTFESTQKSPSSQEPPREPSPAPAPPPTPQIAMAAAGMGAPVTVFAANFGSLKPRVLLIDGTCYASHAGESDLLGHFCSGQAGVLGVGGRVVQRIAKADRDQKISFCCAQSEAAHPYLAAFGLTSSDVLHSPVYIQGFNASFNGTSALLQVACDLPLPYPLLAPFLLIPQPLLNTPFLFAWRRRHRGFKQAPQRSSPPSLTLCPTNPSSLSNFSPSFPSLPLPSPLLPLFAPVLPALLRVACDLPLPYPLLASLLLIPQPLLNAPFLFAWCRRHRWFGQAPRLILPPPDLIGRFVDREELEDEGRRDEDKRHHEMAEGRHGLDKPPGSLD
ncbi:unnamed protein product [Closterium sp. Naga37s-1]|nr:unnamed protein product [Closterium sp. Naga37s-1]